MNKILQQRIEEAAEAIVEDYNHYQFLNDGTKDVYTQSAVLFMLNEMAQFILSNQWISVEEALPEEEKKVLVTHQYGCQVAAIYKDGSHFYWGVAKESPIGASITHWMPIPSLEGGEE